MSDQFQGPIGIGGKPNAHWNPLDGAPNQLEVISSDVTGVAALSATGYGSSSTPIHSHRARGTPDAPLPCVKGDNGLSLGVRFWGLNGFRVSSFAMLVTCTEDTGNADFCGTDCSLETTGNGSDERQQVVYLSENGYVGIAAQNRPFDATGAPHSNEPQAPLHVRNPTAFEVERIESLSHFPLKTFYRNGSRTAYIGHGGDDGDFWLHSDMGDIHFDASSGRYHFHNLPTSAPSGPAGQIWQDGNGFLRVT